MVVFVVGREYDHEDGYDHDHDHDQKDQDRAGSAYFSLSYLNDSRSLAR